VTLLNCEADAAWHKRCGTYDDATIAAMERRDEAWTAVFAAYDAQAAEIRLVRERNAELAAQRLEADDRAYYEGRIAELEAALRAFAPNNIKPGHWALADQNTDDPHEWYCKHCKARAGEWQDIEHAPDCPVTLARAVLDKEA